MLVMQKFLRKQAKGYSTWSVVGRESIPTIYFVERNNNSAKRNPIYLYCIVNLTLTSIRLVSKGH